MAEKKKKGGGCFGFFFGIAVIGVSISALWKNETRFDYHKAAGDCVVLDEQHDPADDTPENICYGGAMDQELTLKGSYVEQFKGFLYVDRNAEIYAWDRDEDSDGDVTWTKRWMSSLQSNRKNNDLSKQLSSDRIIPSEHQVGRLEIPTSELIFIDNEVKIPVSELALIRENLKIKDDYFYLSKGRSDRLGDERVSFAGIPVPVKATYFGKIESGLATPDLTNQRTNWINQMIGDSGVLYYLICGDRDEALAKLKSRLNFVKWLVRGIGTAATVLGFLITLSTVFGILFHIPVIGQVAQTGVFWASILLGVPVAVTTIAMSFLVAHPIWLGLLIGSFISVFWYLGSKAKSSQQRVKNQVERQYGRKLEADDIKLLEFSELTQMALSNGEIPDDEREFLYSWGKQHGWDQAYCDRLIDAAKSGIVSAEEAVPTEQHLKNLIRLALSDGQMSKYEIDAIKQAAARLGYSDARVKSMVQDILRES